MCVSIRALAAGVRATLVIPAAFVASCARGHTSSGLKPGAERSMNLYSLKANTLEGKEQRLADYEGKVTLLVNVASRCGFTPQYSGLERVHQKYASRGFSVLGFPSNDFGAQEPGTADEIRKFCSTKYQVSFPLFEKVQTKGGAGQSPVYTALERASGKLPAWNFGKYLIGRDGRVLDYFTSGVAPEDEKVTAAIEKALSAAPSG